LVIKGDSTLEHIFPPKDEQPEWATFDEDLPDDDDDEPSGVEPRAEGRFALYSEPDVAASPTRSAAQPAKQTVSTPAVVEELDYEALTLAQLRARLQSLDVDELEALLAYEDATKGRAPFQTLLANRITRATAK
jgi:hypothetical protein